LQSGVIKNRKIDYNRGTVVKKTMLDVEITEADDLRPAQLITIAGENYNPPDESRAFMLTIGKAWRLCIAVDDGIEPVELEQGERELYSSDGGERQATIRLKKDGSIVVNGGDDNAVRFSALETAFNELKDKVNEILSGLKTHTHPVAGPLASATTPPLPIINSAANVSPAKIEEIFFP